MWSQVSGGEVIRVIPSPIALTVDSIQYPKNIFTVWSASELKNIGILGSGAWGTALASILNKKTNISLWSYEKETTCLLYTSDAADE